MASGTGTPPSGGGSTGNDAVDVVTEAQRWYYNQQYRLFYQAPYKNCQTFQDAAIVFFPNPSTDFTPLKDMLSGSKPAPWGAGWQEPYVATSSFSAIFDNVNLWVDDNSEQGSGIRHIELYIYCGTTSTGSGPGVNSSESHSGRDPASENRPVTKAKLGNRISKALKGSEDFMDYCAKKGHKFEDLALYSFNQVSPGSWQPTLYVKVTPPAPPSAIVDAGLARLREGHSIHQSAN